ncbi:MAG: hypothetical protein RL005_1410 [Planctomycetota bacterium]
MIAQGLAVAALLAACAAQQVPPVAPAGGSVAPPADPQAVAPTDEAIIRILDAAEAAGARLESLSCTVLLEKRDALTDDTERRRGRLVISGKAGPSRRIGVRIDQFIDGSGRASEDRRSFLYADGWLIERDDARRQLIERQLVTEGTTMDPLQPGEGPLALPVGARRADVLASYVVTVGQLPESTLWKDLPAVDTLRLVPRAGTAAARDHAALIVAWDRATALPIAVVGESTEGDRTLARLRNPSLEPLGAEDRALVERPAGLEGWTVDRRPLKP